MSSHSVLRRLLHDSYAKVKMLRVSDHEPVPTPLKYSYSFAVASPALNYTVVPSSEATLKVLQLNAAMLPFQRHAEERCHRLVSLIKDYDIILLQEVFHLQEISFLQTATRDLGFLHFHSFQGGGIPLWKNFEGTGLLIISKFPIIETMYKAFTLNGKPYKFWHGDYFVCKGVGLARVVTPYGGMVDVYTTHLHANYTDDLPKGVSAEQYVSFLNSSSGVPSPQGQGSTALNDGLMAKAHAAILKSINAPDNDEYLFHRTSQAFELAQFIRATSHNPLIILAGDLNASPATTCLKCIKRVVGFSDAHNDNVITFGDPENTFQGAIPQKLDYILFKNSDQWKLHSAGVFKPKVTIGNEVISISDHVGLDATFTFSAVPPPEVSIAQPNHHDRSTSWNKLLSFTVTTEMESEEINGCLEEANNIVPVLLDVSQCLKLGYLDAKKRYKSHKTGMYIAFLLVIALTVSDSLIHPELMSAHIIVKCISVFCGMYLGVEFVLSQFVVKREVQYTLAIQEEVDRMSNGLKYYIHHLNDGLSRHHRSYRSSFSSSSTPTFSPMKERDFGKMIEGDFSLRERERERRMEGEAVSRSAAITKSPDYGSRPSAVLEGLSKP